RDYKQAVDQLTIVLTSEPKLDAGRWLRARCYLKLNQNELALADLATVAQNQPSHDAILKDYLTLVKQLRGQSELERTLKDMAPRIPPQLVQQLRTLFLPTSPDAANNRTP
ncbi:MAG: hypothetical protein ACPGQS_13750, partial [Bradymonadia bacterium]